VTQQLWGHRNLAALSPNVRERLRVGRCRTCVVLRLCRVVALVAAVAAVAVWPAAAKGPTFGTICGGLGCTALNGQAEISPFIRWWNTPFVPRSAPGAAPYYSIRLRDDLSDITWALLYVPASREMRIWQSRVPSSSEPVGPYWRTVPLWTAGMINTLVRRIVPYPPPRSWR
jgi:hypothetical protein